MKDEPTVDTRLEHIGQHLDQLAARATRAVAELRAQSQLILDDISQWKEHLDLSRVDAEIARMDARDELQRARAALEQRAAQISLRLDRARDDSAEALRSLRVGMDRALHDLGDSLGVAPHDTT
jgi:hypothetical protein